MATFLSWGLFRVADHLFLDFLNLEGWLAFRHAGGISCNEIGNFIFNRSW